MVHNLHTIVAVSTVSAPWRPSDVACDAVIQLKKYNVHGSNDTKNKGSAGSMSVSAM